MTNTLTRRLGLVEATSANMLEMIGVGPFLTIPLMIASMNGPQAMLGWILGAVVAICDGMVWAELGAALPESGGPYRYLLEAYGPRGLGRLMSFLFLWGTVAIAPLSIASGAVGFSLYSKFLWPNLTLWDGRLLAMAVCAAATIALYRDIRSVGRLSILMWIVVLGAAGWIVVSGVRNFNPAGIFTFPANAWTLDRSFFFGLGGATLIAMYDYGGYNNVCFFAGEVKNPGRNVPRSILFAILGVAALYLTMNLTIISVVPWQQAVKSQAIVSDFIRKLHGNVAAQWMTGLILWTAFASVFAVMLGYSRLPYAAATTGNFFRVFARLHPTKHFPTFSLLFLGATSAVACLLDLESLVKSLTVIQILIQFLAQIVAVTLIRRTRPDIVRPYSMWGYPLTSVIAFAGWLFILVASGISYILWGLLLILVGTAAYLWRAKQLREWPFPA